MRKSIAPFALLSLVVASPVFAQSNPSADQIINSLKPSGNLTAGGTRGIRLAAPTGEAASPPQATRAAAAPVAAGQVKAASTHAATTAPTGHPARPSVNLTVNFGNGSAELTPEAMATLDELGRALASNELANYRFRIEGHTDTVGSKEYNQSLSAQRAEAVVHYIEAKYGIQASRLQAVGMGEQGLLVPTPDQTPEPKNRRVEVINLGA